MGDGSAWWLRDARYNEPNGDYHANCYLHVYDVNPNNVRFNDGSCSYYSTEYLCQPKAKIPTKCRNGSPSNCKVTNLAVKGYSPGGLVRIHNGRRVRKSTEVDSCPDGWKVWSPRNKNDWTLVYNRMGKNINNYPKKPHFIVDVTRPANGCGGCTKYAMKSTTAQQGSWRTKDGSAWWLRDARYNEPNGDYHANCYLHVYDVNPNNVRFNDGNCNYYSTEYLCQKALKGYKCAPGSPSNCKVKNIPVKGYSPGQLAVITNGKRVRRSTEAHSCPSGWKIWSPRNKNDWTIVYNAMGKNIGKYPRSPHLIVDVTRGANGCGGCTKYAMNSGEGQQNSWRTRDGSPWWLRDSRYNEPNGDYHANCYLHIYDVNPNNVRFNDGNCNYQTNAYLCQPKK